MSSAAPFPSAPPVRLRRLDPGDAGELTLDALERGAFVAPADVATVVVTGPGAVACVQGLLTNDVETPGDGSFVYGAMLTPKGMIVVDAWSARDGATVRLTVELEGREPAVALLARSIPPRLARIADRSADFAVLRLAGPRAAAVVHAATLPLPDGPGRVAAQGDVAVARAPEPAPFAVQIVAPRPDVADVERRLARVGATVAPPAALELTRILAGWPRLGAEVDSKTIPQEVRYDEIGGVSYTKGCYTGQETVSRLHFRGHTNRELRGLELDAAPASPDGGEAPAVTRDDRDVGRVTSLAALPAERWIGLALLRREVAAGTVVRAAGVPARVVPLPFALRPPRPA
jgi:folate-binding protein YgfZ